MKQFPENINVINKNDFPIYLYDRTLCYLRRDIYDHMLKNTEEEYFDLGAFYKIYKTSTESQKKITEVIIKELEDFNWKCQTSFMGTGLFIYACDKPINCWGDGFE
jgi:cob(I)alamin adenosyltransferase